MDHYIKLVKFNVQSSCYFINGRFKRAWKKACFYTGKFSLMLSYFFLRGIILSLSLQEN